jgi:enamine deaminase RidA (YjgF/YER057c/UK114 family)
MTAEERLQKAGAALPPPPSPLGQYASIKQAGSLLFLSGMLPLVDGKPLFTGHLSKETGREAARLATLNGLSLIKQYLGDLGRVKQVVRAAIYIASDPDFLDHAEAADGCSELLNLAFPDSGKHARLAFGVSSLPKGSSVELELIVEVRD